MARTVPEWIGKTDDTRPPASVRLRVFEAHGGRCYLSGRKIMPGDLWDLDHVKALINGGENRESNLAPALKDAHREKTAADVAEKSKTQRMRLKHLGQWPKSKTPIRNRGFDKTRRVTACNDTLGGYEAEGGVNQDPAAIRDDAACRGDV